MSSSEREEPSIVIGRETYELLAAHIDTDSTHDVTAMAKRLGVPAPDGDNRWMVNRIYSDDGTPLIAWSRSWRVVIDPIGFGWPWPDQSMEIDPELRDRLRSETKDMVYASEIAEHAVRMGVTPPDDSDDWEIYVESMPGRGDGEQLVWYRESDVVITADETM